MEKKRELGGKFGKHVNNLYANEMPLKIEGREVKKIK
jgi:hypothetical protein